MDGKKGQGAPPQSGPPDKDTHQTLPAEMFQSNKSLMVIQEATKNDKGSIPKKLLEYIVRLQDTKEAEATEQPASEAGKNNNESRDEKEKSHKWSTAREQSAWILTQLQSIFLTKERWRIIKVSFIVHTLLWRGSSVFIEEFHTRLSKNELSFFDFTRVLSWVKEMQELESVAPAPSQVPPDKKRQKCTKGQQPRVTLPQGQMNSSEATPPEDVYGATDVFISKAYDLGELTEKDSAFMDSWKQDSNDRIHMLTDETIDTDLLQELLANHMAFLESLLNYRYDYPQVDFMEIVVHDANIYGEGEEKEKMSLLQLKSLLAATLELIKSTAFRRGDLPTCPVDAMSILFRYYNAHVLHKIACQVMTGLVNLLGRDFMEVVRYVDKNGLNAKPDEKTDKLLLVRHPSLDSQKVSQMTRERYESLPPDQKLTFLAREWYTMLYQFNRTGAFYISQSAEVQKLMQLPIAEPKWIRVLPTSTFEVMKTYGSLNPSKSVCLWCLSEEDTPSCHAEEGEHHVPPCAVCLVSAWRQQVKNTHKLFDYTPPSILQTLDKELAEMEKQLRASAPNKEEFISQRQESEFRTSTLTGTFVVRRKGTGSKPSSPLTAEEGDVEVMYLEQLMGKTSDSIETLLCEDDVVVVCPDAFSATDRLKLADRFVVLKEKLLGEGGYGKVYRAWDELEGSYLAAKEVPLDNSKRTAATVRDALHEYTILTQLQHTNVVSVKAFMVAGCVGTIFMEWLPSGSLQEVLRSNPRRCLREPVVARYMRDALRGLEYLHSRDIMHRDVKPANMLLGMDGSVKLTDFGNSFVMAEGGRTVENGTITGTAPYMAPECAQGFYSRAGDIWSLGCTAVELLSGLVPWSSPTTGSRPEMIALIFRIGMLDDKKHTERPHTLVWDKMVEKAGESGLSCELRSFLDSIFVVDRHARPTATQLLLHPFISKFDAL